MSDPACCICSAADWKEPKSTVELLELEKRLREPIEVADELISLRSRLDSLAEIRSVAALDSAVELLIERVIGEDEWERA